MTDKLPFDEGQALDEIALAQESVDNLVEKLDGLKTSTKLTKLELEDARNNLRRLIHEANERRHSLSEAIARVRNPAPGMTLVSINGVPLEGNHG